MKHQHDNNNPKHTYRVDPKTGRLIRWCKTGVINLKGSGHFMNLKKRARATCAKNGTIIQWAPTKILAKGSTNRRVLREDAHGYYHATKGYKRNGVRYNNPALAAKSTKPTIFDLMWNFSNGATK